MRSSGTVYEYHLIPAILLILVAVIFPRFFPYLAAGLEEAYVRRPLKVRRRK